VSCHPALLRAVQGVREQLLTWTHMVEQEVVTHNSDCAMSHMSWLVANNDRALNVVFEYR
jgi:hypothetical protein